MTTKGPPPERNLSQGFAHTLALRFVYKQVVHVPQKHSRDLSRHPLAQRSGEKSEDSCSNGGGAVSLGLNTAHFCPYFPAELTRNFEILLVKCESVCFTQHLRCDATQTVLVGLGGESVFRFSNEIVYFVVDALDLTL